jgi:ubiquinone/menaquinone biosynthesis C-methylase UbiE
VRQNAPAATLILGSAERLEIPDHFIDLLIEVDVIHHMADREAFFREAIRVLRAGGRLCVVTDSHDDIPRRPPSSYPRNRAE